MADGGELEFHGAVTALADGSVAVPKRLTYRHPGKDRLPGLQVDLEVVDGVPWCTRVLLSGDVGSCRVRPTDLKALTARLDQLVDEMLGAAAFLANDQGSGWARKMDTRQNSRPTIRRARQRERRKITPELLRQVADIYVATPGGRTAAIAAAFGVDPRTAGRYIQTARAEGLLAPTTPGKATHD
jgi:hypothetical protein